MADAADRDELTMRAKRKTDPTLDDKDHNSSKSPKLGAIHSDSLVAANCMEISVNNQEVRDICRNPSYSEKENGKGRNGLDKGGAEEDVDSDYDEEDYKEDDEEDEEEDDSYEDEDDERSEVNIKVDRKGKGIMKDGKGKGKLIEEVEDDSSSSGSESDDLEGDLSDDPLAEVDLNNIRPSRTRRRTSRPGVCIASDPENEDDDTDA